MAAGTAPSLNRCLHVSRTPDLVPRHLEDAGFLARDEPRQVVEIRRAPALAHHRRLPLHRRADEHAEQEDADHHYPEE